MTILGCRACFLVAVLVFLAESLTGCALDSPAQCAAGSRTMIADSLYLGMSQPGGVVAAEEWTRFLNEVVTPRFPNGFSSWQTAGQWRSANGEITREDSYVLAIAHPPDATSERAVREIAAAYASQFDQEAVLRVTNRACVSFIGRERSHP